MKTTSLKTSISLLVLCLVPSCDGNQYAPTHSFRITTEKGVQIATTSGGPAYTEPLFRFETILELRQDETNEASILFRPKQLSEGPNGHYFVTDTGNNRVAIFDSQGGYLKSFGQQGSGPGEFRRNFSILWCDEDGLGVFDQQQMRLTLWSLNGDLLGTVSNLTGSRITGMYRVAGDRLVFTAILSKRHSGYQHSQAQVLIQTAANDTIAVLKTRELPTETYEVLSGLGESYRGRISRRFFSGMPIVMVDRLKGILLSSGFEPELQVYGLNGRLVRSIRIEEEIERVGGDLISRYEGQLKAQMEELAKNTGSELRPLPEFKYADTVGLWDKGYWDDEGYLWLQDVKENMLKTNPYDLVFRVIDPEGRYLGKAVAPSAWDFSIANGSYLAVIRDQETGEEVPSVLRIVPNVDGLKYP